MPDLGDETGHERKGKTDDGPTAPREKHGGAEQRRPDEHPPSSEDDVVAEQEDGHEGHEPGKEHREDEDGLQARQLAADVGDRRQAEDRSEGSTIDCLEKRDTSTSTPTARTATRSLPHVAIVEVVPQHQVQEDDALEHQQQAEDPDVGGYTVEQAGHIPNKTTSSMAPSRTGSIQLRSRHGFVRHSATSTSTGSTASS